VTLASLLFLPTASQVNWLAITAVAAAASLGNVPISLNSENYFGTEPGENLLLHVWSLGVEGQFYLFFALLIAYFQRQFPILGSDSRNFQLVARVGFVAVFSFLAFLFIEEIRVSIPFGQAVFSFYSPVPRFWEFFLGAVTAMLRLNGPRRASRSVAIRIAGYSLILVSFILPLEVQSEISKLTLLPVGGAAMVVYASLGDSKPPRTLGRFFGYVGDLSYTWYLWHWPFISIGYLFAPGNYLLGACLALLSLIAAHFTYVGVEKPLRQSALSRRELTFQPVAIGLTVVMAASLSSALVFSTIVAPLNATTALDGSLGWTDVNKEISSNFYDCLTLDNCIKSHAVREPQVLLLGASHAKHLLVGLKETFPDTVFAHIEKSEGVYQGLNQPLLDEIIESDKVTTVIVGEPFLRPDHVFDMAALGWFSRIVASTGKRVLIADGTPILEVPVSLCKSKPLLGGFLNGCVFSSTKNDARHLQTRIQLDAIAASSSSIFIVPTYSLFCSEGFCSAGSSRVLYYADIDHLGRNGSIHVASSFSPFFAKNEE
jgi:peptidoglycan/LPS O-acetylase OafA/YrhL